MAELLSDFVMKSMGCRFLGIALMPLSHQPVVSDGTTNQNTVLGHPLWLEYEYHGTTPYKGNKPAWKEGKDHLADPDQPWKSREGYDW